MQGFSWPIHIGPLVLGFPECTIFKIIHNSKHNKYGTCGRVADTAFGLRTESGSKRMFR